MVPIEQAAVGRQLSVLAAPELRDAKIESEHGKERSENRRPDHRLAPQRSIAAQCREIEPVRDRTEPVPKPLPRRGAQHDLAAGARHVDDRAFRVIEREAVQWAIATIAANGPLVLVDGVDGHDGCLPGSARDGIERYRPGIGTIEAPDADTLREVDHRIRPRRAAQPQDRHADEILDLDAIELLVIRDKPVSDAATRLPRNGRQHAGPLFLAKPREAYI